MSKKKLHELINSHTSFDIKILVKTGFNLILQKKQCRGFTKNKKENLLNLSGAGLSCSLSHTRQKCDKE